MPAPQTLQALHDHYVELVNQAVAEDRPELVEWLSERFLHESGTLPAAA